MGFLNRFNSLISIHNWSKEKNLENSIKFTHATIVPLVHVFGATPPWKRFKR